MTQEYIFIHALSFLTKDVWPVLGRTRCVGISRGIAFEHRCLISHGEWAAGRRVHGWNEHAKRTRRTRVVANLRNEAIAPGWSRAWDARTHVPSSFPMRDACQDGENKESRNLSHSWGLVAGLRRPSSSRAAASRINGTGNTKQRARARTHYAHEEKCVRAFTTHNHLLKRASPVISTRRAHHRNSTTPRRHTSEYLRWVCPER